MKFGVFFILYFMVGVFISCEDLEVYSGVMFGRGKVKLDILMLVFVIMYSYKNYKMFNLIK